MTPKTRKILIGKKAADTIFIEVPKGEKYPNTLDALKIIAKKLKQIHKNLEKRISKIEKTANDN